MQAHLTGLFKGGICSFADPVAVSIFMICKVIFGRKEKTKYNEEYQTVLFIYFYFIYILPFHNVFISFVISRKGWVG